MAALVSKPGISRLAGNAVPKDWSQSWFRDWLSDYAKGADVRNAVGVNGIVVSGNLTSPYATIGFGAPVTLPGTVTITNPTSGLTLNVGGFVSFETSGNLATAGSIPSGLVFVSATSPTRGRIYIGDKTGWHTFFSSYAAGVTTDLIEFADGVSGGHPIVTINAQTNTEGLKVIGASGGSAVHILPNTGNFGLNITVPSGSNQFGILIDASAGGVTRAGIELIGQGGNAVFIATADAASDLIGGSAAGDLCIRSDGQNILFDPNAGNGLIKCVGQTNGVLTDMSPDTGTFTMTMTGFAAANNVTCKWAKMGPLVVLGIPPTTAVASSTTSWTGSGIPAEIRPAAAVNLFLPDCVDNGVGTQCLMSIDTVGGAIFSKGFVSTATSWTAAGNKGVANNSFACVTYFLN